MGLFEAPLNTAASKSKEEPQTRRLYTLQLKPQTLRWGWVFLERTRDSQWNPVYNAFHRFVCCGNETIRR